MRTGDYFVLCICDIKCHECLWIFMSVSACIHPVVPFRQ